MPVAAGVSGTEARVVEVVQADLSASQEFVAAIGDRDLPQLLGAALADRVRKHGGAASGGGSYQLRGGV